MIFPFFLKMLLKKTLILSWIQRCHEKHSTFSGKVWFCFGNVTKVFFFCLFPCLYFINVGSYGKKLFLFKSFFFTDKINLCFVTKLNSFYWAFCGDDDDDDCTACFFVLLLWLQLLYMHIYMGEWWDVWLENVFPIYKKVVLVE